MGVGRLDGGRGAGRHHRLAASRTTTRGSRGRVVDNVTVELGDDEPGVVPDGAHDMYGHGTACGGIILGLAPEVELVSIRVLGADLRGKGTAFAAGLDWAIDEGLQVCNLSLSSKSETLYPIFHDLADRAYFRGMALVSAANNVPAPSYPSLFSSVFSVAAHGEPDPWRLYYNPAPPVEFGAWGVDVPIAWKDGGSTVATGNSFAAPHVAGLVALHPVEASRPEPVRGQGDPRQRGRQSRAKAPAGREAVSLARTYIELFRRNPALARLLTGEFISGIGDWLYLVAILVVVYAESQSPVLLGIVGAARILPYVLLSVPAGIVADRFDRRMVLLVTDLARGGLMLVLVAAVMLDAPTTVIVAVSILAACFSTFFGPAIAALLPMLVDERDLGPANSAWATLDNVAFIIGPALAGILLAVGGLEIAFLLNAVSFAIVAVVLWRLPVPRGAAPVVDDDGDGERRATRAESGLARARAAAGRPVPPRLDHEHRRRRARRPDRRDRGRRAACRRGGNRLPERGNRRGRRHRRSDRRRAAGPAARRAAPDRRRRGRDRPRVAGGRRRPARRDAGDGRGGGRTAPARRRQHDAHPANRARCAPRPRDGRAADDVGRALWRSARWPCRSSPIWPASGRCSSAPPSSARSASPERCS